MHDIDTSDLAGVDLNLLPVLGSLLETGSVTATARALGRTQSTVSHALARLRDALGDPLFVREGRGLVATPRALALREPTAHASRALSEVFRAPRPFDPATSDRSFTLACPDLLAPLLPSLLARLQSEAPSVRLRVVRPGGAHADLALVPAASAHPDQRLVPLGSVSFAVAARADHPGAQDLGTLDGWLAWPHVLVRTGNRSPSLVGEALAAAGRSRRVALEVPGFLLALHVVARTDLLFATPAALLRPLLTPLSLVMAPLPLPIAPIRTGVTWSERDHRDPGHAWLRGVVAEVVRSALEE